MYLCVSLQLVVGAALEAFSVLGADVLLSGMQFASLFAHGVLVAAAAAVLAAEAGG